MHKILKTLIDEDPKKIQGYSPASNTEMCTGICLDVPFIQ